MINIRREAEEVITGKQPRDNNVLRNAPHPISVIALSEDEWNRWAQKMTCSNNYSCLCNAVPIRVSKRPMHCHGFEKGSFGLLSHGWMTVSW